MNKAKATKPRPLGKRSFTGRGFAVVTFRDRLAQECTLQRSSIATERCIWLGVEPNRMHLTTRTVRSLVAHLQAWLDRDTFELEEKES